MKDTVDVAIIGSGPAGLSAALYTAREGRSTLVIEKALTGGLVATIDRIDNYPGLPQAHGGELAGQMWRQAESFGAKLLQATVLKCCKNDNVVKITTDNGVITAKTVVIATGSAYRKLDIPGGDRLHYCATCDGAFYKNQPIAVIGGGNSAVQEAIFLSRYASHIDLVVRSELSAAKSLIKELDKYQDKIQIHRGQQPRRVVTRKNQVVGLKLVSGKTLDVNGVFVFVGSQPSSQALDGSRIQLDDHGYVLTDQNLMTNIPGIFATGDIRSGNVRQIAVAVGDGATVAQKIRQYLKKGV